MRELIQAKVEEICDEQGIDLDDLSAKEINDLYDLAEKKTVDMLADMRDGVEEER